MGLAAAMDISIAVEEAKFGFTEVRIGVAPAVISVMCLSKLRTADARATFLRGLRFSAVEAAEMGLINAAVPADRLASEVHAIVARSEGRRVGSEGVSLCSNWWWRDHQKKKQIT